MLIFTEHLQNKLCSVYDGMFAKEFSHQHIKMLYDVSCTLKTHLQVQSRSNNHYWCVINVFVRISFKPISII